MTNNKQFKKLINLNIDEFMNKIPKVGSILGLDLGEKRIGVAIKKGRKAVFSFRYRPGAANA